MTIFQTGRSNLDLQLFLRIIESDSVAGKNTKEDHVCIVCTMCLHSSLLPRQQEMADILMMQFYLSIYLGHDGHNETAKYLKFSNELFTEAIEAFGDFMNELLSEEDHEA